MRDHFGEYDCDWLCERLELFLDGELSGSENLHFQTHLKECEDCAAYWADDEVLAQALLTSYAVDLTPSADWPSDSEWLPEVARVGDERPITHHSSTIVFDGRGRLLVAGLSALAASLLTAVAFLTFLKDGGDTATKPAQETAFLPVSSAGGIVHGEVFLRDEEDESWRPCLSAEEILQNGRVLKTAVDARLLIRDQGMAVLVEENTLLRIHSVGDGERLDLSLDSGRLSCDFENHDFVVVAQGLELNGRDGAFDLRSGSRELGDDLDSRVAVTRGALNARADVGAMRSLATKDVYVVKDGILVAFDMLSAMTEAEEVRLASSSRANGWAHFEKFSAPPEGHLGHDLGASDVVIGPRVALKAWLKKIKETGTFNLVDPDQTTLRMYEQGRSWDRQALPLIEDLYDEVSALERRALLGLVGALASNDRAQKFLESASFEEELAVRKTAVFCLSRFHGKNLGLHFLKVSRRENDVDLRISAAYLAARFGEGEGLTVMIDIFAETQKDYWRCQIVGLIGRLKLGDPSRLRFFAQVMAGSAAKESSALRKTLRSAVRRAGFESHLRNSLAALKD